MNADPAGINSQTKKSLKLRSRISSRSSEESRLKNSLQDKDREDASDVASVA